MTTPTTTHPRARAAVRAFIHPLLLATIAFGGTTGLGVVWARTQIAATASRKLVQEKRLAQAERTLAELATLLTAEQSVPTLQRRNAEWRLGLLPPGEPQVVRVAAADEQRYAGRRTPGLFADLVLAVPPAAPVAFSGRLAANSRAR